MFNISKVYEVSVSLDMIRFCLNSNVIYGKDYPFTTTEFVLLFGQKLGILYRSESPIPFHCTVGLTHTVDNCGYSGRLSTERNDSPTLLFFVKVVWAV